MEDWWKRCIPDTEIPEHIKKPHAINILNDDSYRSGIIKRDDFSNEHKSFIVPKQYYGNGEVEKVDLNYNTGIIDSTYIARNNENNVKVSINQSHKMEKYNTVLNKTLKYSQNDSFKRNCRRH